MRVLANGEAPYRASGVEAGEGAKDEAAEGDEAEGEGGGSPGRGVELRSRSCAAGGVRWGGVRWAYSALCSSGKVEADTACDKHERIGHQWSSVVISGHQWSSVVIRHERIGCHQWSSVVIKHAIRGSPWPSVAATGDQCSSGALTARLGSMHASSEEHWIAWLPACSASVASKWLASPPLQNT